MKVDKIPPYYRKLVGKPIDELKKEVIQRSQPIKVNGDPQIFYKAISKIISFESNEK